MKTNRRVPQDHIDLENFDVMRVSQPFRLVLQRITNMQRVAEKKLRTCTPDELASIQAEVNTIETILAVPAILHDELIKTARANRQ